MSIVEAIKSLSGDVTGEAIKDALTKLNYTGVTGVITFDQNGDAKKNVAFIESFVDGNMKLVGFQSADGTFTAAK